MPAWRTGAWRTHAWRIHAWRDVAVVLEYTLLGQIAVPTLRFIISPIAPRLLVSAPAIALRVSNAAPSVVMSVPQPEN